MTWNKICDSVADIVPSIGELIVDVTGSDLMLRARSENFSLALKDLGTGVEQLLLVAVACESQQPRRMVVIDEPEAGIHPTAQRKLVSYLRKWSEERQIVVVTHSPTIIEPSSSHPNERVYVVRFAPDNQRSVVEQSDPLLWKALDVLGASSTDVFGATKVILVEGKTEVACFTQWFNIDRTKPWLKLIDLEGSTKARTSVEAIEKLEHFDSDQVLAILDADEGSKSNHKRVQTLVRREIENYFFDDLEAVRTVLREDGANLGLEQLKNVVDEAIESHKSEVIFLRCRELLLKSLSRPSRLQSDEAAATRTLEDLQCRVEKARESVPGPEGVDESWNAVSNEVNANWSAKKVEIVAGSSVLQAVWTTAAATYGYGKATTGPRIAAAMKEPPSEIAKIVEAFISGKDEPRP